MAKINAAIVKEIKNYISDIRSICPIDKAVLFGSYAKGTQRKDSDIDIAVFSRKINDSNRHKYMSLFLTHILKYRLDIQPIAFSLKEYNSATNEFITDEIKKKGIVVYNKQ